MRSLLTHLVTVAGGDSGRKTTVSYRSGELRPQGYTVLADLRTLMVVEKRNYVEWHSGFRQEGQNLSAAWAGATLNSANLSISGSLDVMKAVCNARNLL